MRVSVDGGKKWFVIQIPIGSYEIRAINSSIKKLIEKKRIQWKEVVVAVAVKGEFMYFIK